MTSGIALLQESSRPRVVGARRWPWGRQRPTTLGAWHAEQGRAAGVPTLPTPPTECHTAAYRPGRGSAASRRWSRAAPGLPANITALLGARVIMDVLATLVEHGHLGTRLPADQRAQAERERERLAGINNQYLPMLGDRHHQ